jgi:hypothetical protein
MQRSNFSCHGLGISAFCAKLALLCVENRMLNAEVNWLATTGRNSAR